MKTTVLPKGIELAGETGKSVSRDKLRKQVEVLIREAINDGDRCAAEALQNVLDDFDSHELMKNR